MGLPLRLGAGSWAPSFGRPGMDRVVRLEIRFRPPTGDGFVLIILERLPNRTLKTAPVPGQHEGKQQNSFWNCLQSRFLLERVMNLDTLNLRSQVINPQR